MADSNPDWKPKRARPMSTIAINFSAALDDLFKLGTVGELETTIEERNREVQSQQSELESLEAQLRRADEELRRLQIKHKRMSQRFSPRRPVEGLFTPTSPLRNGGGGGNFSSSDDSDGTPSSPRMMEEADEAAQ